MDVSLARIRERLNVYNRSFYVLYTAEHLYHEIAITWVITPSKALRQLFLDPRIQLKWNMIVSMGRASCGSNSEFTSVVVTKFVVYLVLEANCLQMNSLSVL